MLTAHRSWLATLFNVVMGSHMRLVFKSVHDPAWWWAEASNLRASSDAVVRFNLAHVHDSVVKSARTILCMYDIISLYIQSLTLLNRRVTLLCFGAAHCESKRR